MVCSIARTLDVIGEPWSPLILRDVWAGVRRFDHIRADLGISRKVLTERLNHLVEHGVIERLPTTPAPATSTTSPPRVPTASRCSW
ncbi:winged helix-turn-helix transcriptional regulator [Streptomyces bauhiniae]|uniref:winged helix-turn-helix transcriptional regulator n=1 Tax=Streptomyces bauhiniae TaxID=2340725 RepID=UPI001ABF43B7